MNLSTLLIANRGEIACRIIATARRMGIATVAVYSEADASALHVAMADQAVPIGPPPAAESYLLGDRIIAAALATGADAIHPGYGFLSENADFADAVAKAGLVFVGPKASSIRAMGMKDAAKRLMEKAGVPVVPGYHGEAQEIVVLAAKANEIGYPVLIKAAAGGGGRGMRKVERPEDFRESLAAAKRESKAAFSDDRVIVEKLVAKPRHIEVQVFGDSHGNVVHLFERDCSAQRRHQKVIEEAPAPGMTPAMRQAMTQAAIRAARAVDYRGAGTVEFVVDGSHGLKPDAFWFMEMNTRLQVEHPVTELVTGLDLVEWQLRVAAGEPLPLRQEDIRMTGHAFEARLYAEDAARGFLPATGRLRRLRFPEGVRADSGVRQDDEITPWYDPMIAKIATRGNDRGEALEALRAALAQTEIAGTVTNRSFLHALASDNQFAAGEVDTSLIDRRFAELTATPAPDAFIWSVAALRALDLAGEATAAGQNNALAGFTLWTPQASVAEFRVGESLARVELRRNGASCVASTPRGSLEFRIRMASGDRITIAAASGDRTFSVPAWQGHVAVLDGPDTFEFALRDPSLSSADPHDNANTVRAPMPGLVRQVLVAAGEKLRRGDPVAVLEAMKMEHALAAPRAGAVKSVAVKVGDRIDEGALLVELEDAG
jgi:3-methylcrotonyl-CoA carboxylase alpha subunit